MKRLTKRENELNMKKIIISALIASTFLTPIVPTTLWAAMPKKASLVSTKVPQTPTLIPVKLLNAKVVDQHLYSVFTGELLVSDAGLSKQISVITGNQVINVKYKSTREDGKEIWGFSLGFNRNEIFVDDALTFVIRYKSKGKVIWDTNPKYKLTDESNAIFGDSVIKLEDSFYDWTSNSVDGTVLVKEADKKQGVTVTYSIDNWNTRKVAIAKLQRTDSQSGLQRWVFSLPTDSQALGVQYFVVLNTPKKTYIDNNAGLGYNIYR